MSSNVTVAVCENLFVLCRCPSDLSPRFDLMSTWSVIKVGIYGDPAARCEIAAACDAAAVCLTLH